MNKLYNGPFSRVLLVKPHGSTGLAFALNPIPLGLESIASNIRKNVDNILIYDQFLDKEPFTKVLSKFKPDLVGFSLSATEHDSGELLMHKVKNYDERIPIIAGGYHATGAPDIVLNSLKCDLISRGEGEEIMKDLVKGVAWENIDGISYKSYNNGSKIIHNKDRITIKDLDTLEFPARDLRKKRGYKYKNVLLMNREYDLMEFGRGCYGKCTFCCEPYHSKSSQRYKTPERTVEEIKQIWKLHNKKPLRILIADPNILGNPRKVRQLCDLLIKLDLDITFQVMTRTEMIVRHPDIVELMIRAGMISWELGIESDTEEDLINTKKNIPLRTQKRAVEILRKLGAETLGTFVVGLSSHTSESIKKFPDFAREIGVSAAAFGIATPFPGTGFWDELSSQNLIFEKQWSKYDENNSVFKHPTLSPNEIEKLRDWCTAKFWNLDTVLEQIRLDQNRIGKFRSRHRASIMEFITMVLKKIIFASEAGSELAEKEIGNNEENYVEHARFVFDAWANPRLEQYFEKNPMHEIVEMRKFGRFFAGKNGGKNIQIIVENEDKKCVFALLIVIDKTGIKTIKTSRKPVLEYNFLLRVDLKSLYMDSNLSLPAQLKQVLKIFSNGKIRIQGIKLLFKMILFGIKESLLSYIGKKSFGF